MKKNQLEIINKNLEVFLSDLFNSKPDMFKQNEPGDVISLLTALLSKSNYLIKWTRKIVNYHEENPLMHDLESPSCTEMFTLSGVSRVTVDKLNEVLQSKFFGFQKSVSKLCKHCDIPYKQKIKSLKLGKVLIFKTNENESEGNIDELKVLRILNFTYKLTSININKKILGNDFHSYCICKESDQWFEYNDNERLLISDFNFKYFRMLIYSLDDASNEQSSEQLINVLQLEPNKNIEVISIKCHLIKGINEVINKDPIILLIPINHSYAYLKDQVISSINENFSNIIINQEIKLYIWKLSNENIYKNVMKSVKSKLYSFPGHQLEENGRVRNIEIDKDTYIIVKIIARNPISYNFTSLPALSRKGLTGLQRSINDSCMNSVIQCLSNTLELTENIISGKLKNVMIAKHQNKYRQLLVYYYIKLIKQIWIGEINFSIQLV